MRHQIEQTRLEMGETIDAIADRASPRRMAARQRQRMSVRIRSAREAVMGTADTASSTAAGVAEGARHAPEQLAGRTRGNPLAAGLVAFGGGMIVASLAPPTRTEQQVASRLQDEMRPAVDAVREAGSEVAGDVKESASQAADEVRETARDSARSVTEQARGGSSGPVS